ncbi:hypothetical protein RE428_43830 [Marinobacter nanhaiticus D15-8W]|nr:hypothetical protein RE428_43830 [Marinobacter nanhaiticus D15-8W]
MCANAYVKAYYGHRASNLVGKDLFSLLSKASQIIYESYVLPLLMREGRCDEIQLGLVTADGDNRPVVVNARLDTKTENTIYWSIADASQRDSMLQELTRTRQQLQEKVAMLQTLSFTDKLTGLPNRAALTRHLDQKIKNGRASQAVFALAFLDLDGFKNVNDRYGHATGDKLLRQVARRMSENLRSDDLIARFGGDEFVLLMDGDFTNRASESLLTRLIAKLAEPFEIDAITVGISASIGVTFYPQAEEVAPDQLVRQADHAMYQAKIGGRNQMHLFNVDRERHLRNHNDELAAIRAGIDANQFELFYQPKVNMRTGQMLGAEALLQWLHPDRGRLAPGTFLPVVNDTSVGVRLGEWVLATALKQLQAWLQQGLELDISVNIAGYHLQHPDFLRNLGQLLSTFPPALKHHLELEILETSTIEDIHHVSSVLLACKQMGIKVSLDDFGTGYSTLGHLRDLSVDTLKIDRSFVKDMAKNEGDMAILKDVIGLAQAFQCNVIAEGVETRQHAVELIALGCEWGQGYYIARPMPAMDLEPWIRTWYGYAFQDKLGISDSQDADTNHHGDPSPC